MSESQPFLVLDSTKERNQQNPAVPLEFTVYRLQHSHEAHCEVYKPVGYLVHSEHGTKRWFAYRYMPWGRSYLGSFQGSVYSAKQRAIRFICDLS